MNNEIITHKHIQDVLDNLRNYENAFMESDNAQHIINEIGGDIAQMFIKSTKQDFATIRTMMEGELVGDPIETPVEENFWDDRTIEHKEETRCKK